MFTILLHLSTEGKIKQFKSMFFRMGHRTLVFTTLMTKDQAW